MVAAILHLGNINFAKGEEIDSSVIKDAESRFHLDMTADLLRYIYREIYKHLFFFTSSIYISDSVLVSIVIHS